MAPEAERGRILPPDLDDRTWEDLVSQMRALIPRYAPGWTDQGPGDLGITLIELFAWLVEGVIYRLNRVPEKNYVAFLDLLGITRDPPAPARTDLTFTTAGPGPLSLPAGVRAQTLASGDRGAVTFETDEPVTVLPVNLTGAVLLRDGSYRDAGPALVGPPAGPVVLTVPAGGTVRLALGFDAATTDRIAVGLRLFRPALPGALTAGWSYSTVAADTTVWTDLDAGPDAAVQDGTGALTGDGTVRIRVPQGWAAQTPSAPPATPDAPAWSELPAPASETEPAQAPLVEPRYWLRLTLTAVPAENPGAEAESAVAVGIDRILVNSVPARTALTLPVPEDLGRSSGEPFQAFALTHRPVFRAGGGDPFRHVEVDVGTGEPATWVRWERTDDLPDGPGAVYRLNPVTGEIGFGDHDAQTGLGHGSVPPPDARVRARYRYVALGAEGNVPAGRVVVLATGPDGEIPAGVVGVTNPGQARDGADEEPIEETLRRAPEQLVARDRAVTAADYEFLAREASNDVAIVRGLGPRAHATADTAPVGGGAPAWLAGDPWSFGGIVRAPGRVTVIVVPRADAGALRPDLGPGLRELVRTHLNARRELGAELDVVGPRYLPVVVTARIRLWQQAENAGADAVRVEADVREAIDAFLHPTHGGPEGTGWQIGQHVLGSDLFAAIGLSPELGYVAQLVMRPGIPRYHFPPINPRGKADEYDSERERPFAAPVDPQASVRVADYELVCAPDPAEPGGEPHVVDVTVEG